MLTIDVQCGLMIKQIVGAAGIEEEKPPKLEDFGPGFCPQRLSNSQYRGYTFHEILHRSHNTSWLQIS